MQQDLPRTFKVVTLWLLLGLLVFLAVQWGMHRQQQTRYQIDGDVIEIRRGGDGRLVVVSRDLSSAHDASGIAARMQQLLDDWNFISPQLEDLAQTLNVGQARHAFAFDPKQCMAPLPRAYRLRGFGVLDAGFGEALAAAVPLQPRASLGVDEVRAFLRQRLADYEVPKQVAFRAQLPREGTGKIFKRKQREPYRAGSARRI